MLTRDHFSRGIALLAAAYPLGNRKRENHEALFLLVQHLEPEEFERAVLLHISSSKWYPSVSEILALAQPETAPTAAEAWHEVVQAIDSYAPEPSWSHPCIASAVKIFGGWQSWCRGVKESERSYNGRRFTEAYADSLRRHRETSEREQVAQLQAGGMLRLEE